jgi:hypothetical protein
LKFLIRGVFERRGRKGYAEIAKEDKKEYKKYTRPLAYLFGFVFLQFSFFFFLIFKNFVFTFSPFCALCETFATSAFKKFFIHFASHATKI